MPIPIASSNINSLNQATINSDKRTCGANGVSEPVACEQNVNSLVQDMLNFARQKGYTVSMQDGTILISNRQGEISANITISPDGKQIDIQSYDNSLTEHLDNIRGKFIHRRWTPGDAVEFTFFPKLSKREIILFKSLGFNDENGLVSVAYNLSKKTPPERMLILGELVNLPNTFQDMLAVGSERMSQFTPVNPTVGNYVVEAIEWALANGYADGFGLTGICPVGGPNQGDLYHGHLCIRQGATPVAPGNCTQDFFIVYHSRETENGEGESAYMRNFYQDSSRGKTPISTSRPGLKEGVSAESMGLEEIAMIYIVVCPEGKYTVNLPDGRKVRVNIYYVPKPREVSSM